MTSKKYLVTLDLSNYTSTMVDAISKIIEKEVAYLSGKCVAIGLGKRALTVTNTDGTDLEVIDLSKDDGEMLAGLITLVSITRSALPTHSYHFVEWFALKYYEAFALKEFHLCDTLSEDIINDAIDAEGIVTIDRQFITRWSEKGVVCSTDVAVYTTYYVSNEDEDANITKLPVVHPIVMVGEYFTFNQAIPFKHLMQVNHFRKEDPLTPAIIGANVFSSTGIATVTACADGLTANCVCGGVKYTADVVGLRPLYTM